ncbi:HAD-IIB family hydrolase [Marinihelvus fidelis]|uniref:HAD-IIB family hydrolase n=1 Tax=Marinihelvus fidelis TaxID=2613842 RepID=A0A5N0TD48_9GAMM|nr:HAD-IIB family hydrolase [Marinihelvus fidelis]KAA9132608.1 HAD-IIB family hydrolase [Marinihelvus fidelis]
MSACQLLVCTDLDRTLIPNGPQPESPGARELFARLAGHAAVRLAYVSGRDPDRVHEAIAEFDLPPPDFIIADVGTTLIEAGEDGTWRDHTAWSSAISGDWNGHGGDDLHQWLADVDGLRRQEPDRQAAHKLSYYAPLEPGDRVEQVRRRLDERGVRARVVWSVDEIRQLGLVDVLPASASKYHAIRALMNEQSLALDDTVFCGDSGNDMEVLVSEIPAVLVANAAPEIMTQAREASAAAGHGERLYIAMGGFMGMNGCYAAGMLEGICHFHPVARGWLAPDRAGAS